MYVYINELMDKNIMLLYRNFLPKIQKKCRKLKITFALVIGIVLFLLLRLLPCWQFHSKSGFQQAVIRAEIGRVGWKTL